MFYVLLLSCWLAAPVAGQTGSNTCTETEMPFSHITQGPNQALPPLLFLLTTIKVFNSKGHLIATYTFQQYGQGQGVKISVDGMPYTADIIGNPTGTYPQDTASNIANSICPKGAAMQKLRTAGPAPSTSVWGQAANAYAYGDFNGDGYGDSAAANGSTVVVTLFGADASAISKTVVPLPGQIPDEIVTADFNGDGILDLAVLYAASNPSGQAGVAILLGNGDGTFGAPTEFAAGSGPNLFSMAVGDFNGDGKPDLAVAGYVEIDTPPFSLTPQLGILLGNGDGTFAPPLMANVQSMKNPESMVVADFTGDGILDLAVLDWRDLAPDPDEVWVLPGNGDGTFGTPIGTIPGTGRGLSCIHRPESRRQNGSGDPGPSQ